MKSDEDVKVTSIPISQMISAESPALLSKACEMFISELTYRAWYHTEENNRRTLLKTDLAQTIKQTDILDFLLDIVPIPNPPPPSVPTYSSSIEPTAFRSHAP